MMLLLLHNKNAHSVGNNALHYEVDAHYAVTKPAQVAYSQNNFNQGKERNG